MVQSSSHLETSAIVHHPFLPQFVTLSNQGFLAKWCTERNTLIGKMKLEYNFTAADCYKDGKIIAAATYSG